MHIAHSPETVNSARHDFSSTGKCIPRFINNGQDPKTVNYAVVAYYLGNITWHITAPRLSLFPF
jgi:hypothetical protein